MHLARESASMAESVTDKVGFDPTPIFAIFLPMILQCAGIKTGQGLQELALAHFNEEAGRFDKDAINRLRPRAKLAAIKALRRGQIDQMPDRAGLDEISVAMLTRAMDGDRAGLEACAAEAESIDVDAE